ncbi:peptide ABC transporter [Paenibacillus vortex V453]|jgi:peptide/nickel transport system permease protein|uniref:Peptide ABC transporter n=1 Tax=Paenibacillus vortex V453 TaxID=715225 RepID=A0A2R9SUY0_9BACL|nr:MULTISPECIES: nickel transporter permease [Paenibacillus]ANA82495.1 peptide ABC transporter permease [Paenibacillus glucanolyticus]AVV58763.1 ABC transporter permease [Paenibacillus glucanolyticus]AWP27952.1 peptide ABC transporter permease [Paenibacillus sp. Cedars]EFU41188.1 peptide ABC transporter [Paenibacillus vortex V453]ETT33793.1 peptide ABC transporter permease [Paenibacillus sp. FSL R5-808]
MPQITTHLNDSSAIPSEKVSGPWRNAWRAFRKNKIAMAGLFMILFFIVIALLAPLIAPYDYKAQELADRLKPPSAEHWFGTDDLGRDLLSRVLHGTRISLWVGTFSVLGSIILGTLLGILAGFYGKWIDMIISRFFDILLAFPSILLAIAIVAILGPSLQNALYAIAIVNIPTYGRLVRAKVLSLKNEEYISAAQAIGMKNSGILRHHILPNSLTPIIVQGTLGIATAIIEAAALGFLGLGAQPPAPEWGKMLSDSRQFIATAPWTVIFPGVSIMLTVLAFNLMGDGLRDALDPRMKS